MIIPRGPKQSCSFDPYDHSGIMHEPKKTYYSCYSHDMCDCVHVMMIGCVIMMLMLSMSDILLRMMSMLIMLVYNMMQ